MLRARGSSHTANGPALLLRAAGAAPAAAPGAAAVGDAGTDAGNTCWPHAAVQAAGTQTGKRVSLYFSLVIEFRITQNGSPCACYEILYSKHKHKINAVGVDLDLHQEMKVHMKGREYGTSNSRF